MWGGKIYGIRRTEIGRGWYSGGPFVCHNHLAACLNLGLGFALGGLLARSRADGWASGRRLGPAYASSLIVIGILASHSRGGFLAMAASTVFVLEALRGGAGRGRATLAAMATVATMVALFLAAIGSGSLLERVGTILDSGTSGINGRMEIWGVAVRTWWAHPLVGTGLGSFAWVTIPGFDRDRGVYFSHAENEPLQMLVEGGGVGLGLVLLGLAGIARFGRRGLAAMPWVWDRALMIGGLAGGLAVLVQSLGDFALRIPGVGVSAVILAAHICRMGLDARVAPEALPISPHGPLRLVPGLVGVATVVLSLVIVRHGMRRAEAEAQVLSVGLPPPGGTMPDLGCGRLPRAELERMRLGLERALRARPDWCEGHLRLGITLMALYETTAKGWLDATIDDPDEAAALADPMRLHAVVHAGGPVGGEAASLAMSHEPVRRFLTPAARSFLEARRSCPVAALAHAGLGGVDYLVERGEPGAIHAERALRLSGLDGPVAARAGRIASQVGDPDLASRCWRKAFAVGIAEADWAEVAQAVAASLPPEMILERVLDHSGRDTLRFACLIFADPDDADVRDRFLRAALARIRRDPGPESARLWHEGQALAWLGDPGRARARMRAAIDADPLNGAWRGEFIDWLIGWGDVREAHREAVLGAALEPHRDDPSSTLMRAVAALAVEATPAIGESRTGK